MHVIFDLDGTLVDSLGDIANCTNAVLSELGFPTHAKQVYKKFVGDGARVLIERALPADAQDQVEIALTLYKKVYHERVTDTTKPYPGIADMLAELDRLGATKAVLTNKPQKASEALVAHLFGGTRWVMVCGQKDGVPTKPDPTQALDILKQFGVAAHTVLYVGDTDVDMQTATRAGMTAVGVLWGFREADELRANGAKVLLAHPMDLFKAF